MLPETDKGRLSLDDYGVLQTLQTPCYVYDPLRVAQDYADLKQHLGTALLVSIKANSDPDLLAHCLPGFRDGIELASLRELGSVRDYDIPKFVNTPGLTPELLRSALLFQATLVLDNLYQVDLMIAEARGRAVSPVVLRLNSGELVPEIHRRGPGDRFGMSIPDLIEAGTRLQSAGVALRGIHIFAGSNMFVRSAQRIVERLIDLLPNIEQSLGCRIGFLNLGGGIPPDWRLMKFDFQAYRDLLSPLRDGRVLAHETGRAVFTNCGAFVARVLSHKKLNEHQIVACDGGMVHSFQLAQTELPVKLRRVPELVYADGGRRSRAAEPLLFVGNTCTNVDMIGRMDAGALLPEPGDYCIFDAVGAYFATYTLTGFLGIPPAHVYIKPGMLGAPETSSRIRDEPALALGESGSRALGAQ